MKTQKYKIRTSPTYGSKHIHDNYKNLGYDYRGKLLKKTTSSQIWANPYLTPILLKIETLILFLIETTKSIKKHFSIAHDKNTSKIN